ncbi:MAG: PAS domain S-box protein [Candidatus Bathyarchaeia archaeon]
MLKSCSCSKVKDRLRHVYEMLHVLTDGIDEIVYVVDPENYEILFANKKTRKVFGAKIVGEKCYKIFHGRRKPCPFCTNKELVRKGTERTCIRELQNKKNKKWYKCIDKAIEWPGKKYVRFGIAIDITAHQKLKETLQISEKRYRHVIENAPIVIYTLSPKGTITSLNPIFEKITGWPIKEWLGKNFASILHPEDLPRAKEAFEKISRGARLPPVELRVLSKSGKYLIGEFMGIPWRENGKLIGQFGIARDITEHKRMEEALRESERRYRKLIETAPVVIYTLSLDGTITSLNPKFEEVTGWSCHEWLGKSFVPLIHPDDLPLAMETFQKALQGEAASSYELRIRSKSGEYLVGEFTSVPLIENGKIIGEFGVVQDITKRKLVENALREGEELFRSVVENSHDTIVIIDDDFRIVYVNDQAVNLSGYPKKEIIGQDFRKYLPEKDKVLVESRYIRRQKGESIQSPYEFRIVRKNGEERDVEAKVTIIKDSQGKVRSIVHLRDITERKKMENERKRFEERLSALNVYGQNLNMAKNLKELYELTLDATEKTLGFEYASLLMIEGKMLCMVGYRGYSKNFSIKLPLDGERGITTRVARTGKPIFVPDVRKDKAYVEGGEGIRSELAVPIKIGKKVLGVLNVESKKTAAFSEQDKKLLEILASHAAIALSNLKRQEKLSALNAYARSLNRAENLDEICTITLNAMEKVLGFNFVDVFVVEGKKLRLAATRGLMNGPVFNLPLDGQKGITVRAARTGKTVLVPDVRKDKAYVEAGTEGMLSELAVPIKLRNKVLGVLNVESDRIAAFDEEDKELLDLLASHIAIAISNLRRRERLKEISKKLENLMKNSTEIMHIKDMHTRLKVIAKAIQNFGWRRVVISLTDENLDRKEIVTAGLTAEDRRLLMKRRAPGRVWQERLGPKFEKYRIGEFYYLPWNDPWIREHAFNVPPGTPQDVAVTIMSAVPSRLSEEEMVDWHPQDMVYAPLRTPTGRIVGLLTMDDPVDGRKPTKESLVPLELFLHQAAITIENAQLIESLRKAREQLETYAGQLEQKVEERTRELKKSQEQLLKAQRFAVIGELAGMVGHDLRNPLTSIAGAQYYLKKRLSSENEKIKEMLELIEKNIAYSNKIINDLLDYSREIELEAIESDPRTLVQEVLSIVGVPTNVKVKNFAEHKPKMEVDTEKVKRVFMNLIKNAIEAMPKGGVLTIKSRKVKDKVEITFSDTGVGMSKETLRKLWTPLFTTKSKGMGFGLPICKRFVEAHGGCITVESARGKGTTFTVTLPIKPKMKEGGEKLWVKPLESSLSTMTKT